MLKMLFWGGLLSLIVLGLRARYQRLRRRLRGEPEPARQGPRTVTLILVAIGLVYGGVIVFRLATDGLDGIFY
ncbi:MAG: hypothetical protein CMP08_00170 [Xanthomonadales bacterium]|nr:hypothetical protein [Xanthomonadales bacterium]|tara:strand:- start:2227 stop:2445 length:219 start_codon:yes stop_codon:yes gene_type:complete